MKNQYIQLIPADISLAEAVVDYYKRNWDFLKAFEPARSEEFYIDYQPWITLIYITIYASPLKDTCAFYI